MKKVLLGCGCLVLIVLGVCGYFGYRFFSAVQKVMVAFQEVGARYDATNVSFPFKANTDGMLTDDQVTRWLSARAALSISEADFKTMSGSPMKMMGDFIDKIVNTAKNHATKLEENKISFDEYVWVTNQAIGALKHPKAAEVKELDAARAAMDKIMAQGSGSGSSNNPNPSSVGATVTDAQAENSLGILAKHAEELEASMGALFGESLLTGTQMRQAMGKPAITTSYTYSKPGADTSTSGAEPAAVTPAGSPLVVTPETTPEATPQASLEAADLPLAA